MSMFQVAKFLSAQVAVKTRACALTEFACAAVFGKDRTAKQDEKLSLNMMASHLPFSNQQLCKE